MRIGIDFDSTITVDPRFFRRLSMLLGKGNRIYVISSYERKTPVGIDEARKTKARKLKGWGIRYSKLDLVREPIPRNKAELCNRYGIDIMIDDDEGNVRAINRLCRKTVCLQFAQGRMRL